MAFNCIQLYPRQRQRRRQRQRQRRTPYAREDAMAFNCMQEEEKDKEKDKEEEKEELASLKQCAHARESAKKQEARGCSGAERRPQRPEAGFERRGGATKHSGFRPTRAKERSGVCDDETRYAQTTRVRARERRAKPAFHPLSRFAPAPLGRKGSHRLSFDVQRSGVCDDAFPEKTSTVKNHSLGKCWRALVNVFD